MLECYSRIKYRVKGFRNESLSIVFLEVVWHPKNFRVSEKNLKKIPTL